MVRELEKVEEIATNQIKWRPVKFDEKLLPVISLFLPSFSPNNPWVSADGQPQV